MAKTVGLYLRTSLEAELEERGDNRSHIINRDLDRLYTLYRRAIREVPLTLKEACLIVDTMNSTLMDANSAQLLWASVEDAINLDGLDVKWEVEGSELVGKLKGLTAFQCMALVDGAERFWNLPDDERVLEAGVRKFFSIVGDSE